MILVKSSTEIEYMRESGKIVATVHSVLKDMIKPGITTKELDEIAERIILEHGAQPAFKGYGGFPATICASVNEEVVHGIPGDRMLREGDIISIDVGALKNGYYGDSAKTYPVGKISAKAEKLIRVTRESFYEGLKFCKVGYRLSDVSHAIQMHVEAEGFSVVRDYVGHGIGASLHEDPQIPNYGPAGKGPRLSPGMVLAIEPMINAGRFLVRVLGDNWTVVTADGSLSAHYEHTIAITDEDPIILTTDQ
ncbi:type I methionyl aminopeptidase [Acidaminobacter sp.]|uniref:type I methionyl aminopeptidase n=1 Tax=Acidaminobacter sp. TaxID=1872102 RepID=UPI002565E542|nr:type I methionyl aminopeptidase [Acidaminobacter sp.]MDK9712000.1 type I methionyl aminopeptidase [Acidaminobacter sp.]